MRWRRIALWLFTGALALAAVGILWLWTADLGVFKPQLEQLVRDKTNRNFSIDGPLQIDLGGRTSVIAEDIHFGNADWSDQQDMVTVGRLELRLDLWSLIRGPIVIERVDLRNGSLLLINPESGDPNWVLATEDRKPESRNRPGPNVVIQAIGVEDVRLVLDSAERERTLELNISSFRQARADSGLLDIDLQATLNDRPIRIDGELGPWQSMRAGKDIQFDIDAIVDTFELSAHGHIDDLAHPAAPEINFAASCPDIDDLTRLLGLGEEGNGDINLSGSLLKTADNRLVLETRGNLGQAKVEARGSVSDLQNPGNTNLELLASGPDLGRILRLIGFHKVRDAPFTVRIDAETRDDVFIVNELNVVLAEAQIDGRARMPRFPSIDDAVIGLHIEGPDLARFHFLTGVPAAAKGPFSVDFTIDVNAEGVELLDFKLQTTLLEARADGNLGELPELYSSQLNFELRSDSLSRLAAAYGIPSRAARPGKIAGTAEYIEGRVRLSGPVRAEVGENTVSVDGFIALQPGAAGSALDFSIEGPDLAKLVGLFTSASLVPGKNYALRGRVGLRDGALRFRDATGQFGSSAITLEGSLLPRRGIPDLQLDIGIAGPSLADLTSGIGDIQVRDLPYTMSTTLELRPDRLRFRDLKLSNSTGDLAADLTLGLPVSKQWLDLDLQAQGSDVRALLQEVERFEASEQPYSLNAKVTRRADNWSFETLDANLGEASLRTKGDLNPGDTTAASTFDFNLTVPSLASLGTFDGRRFNDQGLSLVTSAVGQDGTLTFEKIVGKIGDSDFSGRVRVSKNQVVNVEAEFFSDAIMIAPLLEAVEFEYDPTPKFEDGRLIPDMAVPFDAMRKYDAALGVEIGQLRVGAITMSDIAVDARLRDGALDVSHAGFNAWSGALATTLRLEPSGESGSASLDVVARNFSLGLLQTDAGSVLRSDIDIALDSSGADLRTLLANANGIVYLDGRGGRITTIRWLKRLYGDALKEILNTINPFRKEDPYTDFDCIVMPLRIKDGQINAAPDIFVRTNRINAVASPSINLKTEALEAVIRTSPRRSLLISLGELVNPYIKVVGTLAAPRLAVDEKGVLISGGAAIASGGLTVVARSLWDRLKRAGDPCGQATKSALEKLGDKLPDLEIDGLEHRN